MGKDPTVVERIKVGVEEQAKEYQILSNQVGKILEGLTKIKRDGQATAAAANPQADKDPKFRSSKEAFLSTIKNPIWIKHPRKTKSTIC